MGNQASSQFGNTIPTAARNAGLGLTTMTKRASIVYRVLLALALAGTLFLLSAAVVSADEYGGLGSLAVFTAGEHGGHLEVNAAPEAHRAFGVDPVDGSSYIADELTAEGKHYFRIQKLGAKGEYLTETRVELGNQAYQLEGIAIDSVKERLYVLVVDQRKGESEAIEEKIGKDEEALERKENSREQKKKKGEPTEQVEQEIKELKELIEKLEEELPVFDPEAPVVAQLYAFSTKALEPATGTNGGLLAGEKAFSPFSEEGGVPLLRPHGIAVDPVTHDVLILGQQDESARKGEEELHTAVQRVHTEGAAEGELGPRYMDEQNCLDEGVSSKEEEETNEELCSENSGEPSSPFVSPGGRFYGERSGELWEIPATEGVSGGISEAFTSHPKVYAAKPKRLFTIGREQGIEKEEGIVEPVSEGEEGGALAFVPTTSDEGRIYLDANIKAEEGEGRISENGGAVVLDYSEHGGTPEAKELGWTAGQNGTSENEKCILPLGSAQALVGADSSGRLLLFDVTTKPATVNVLQFGAGGEECGHAHATPPSVSVKGQPVTTLKAGQNASLSLDVFGADTNNVEWKFLDNGKEEANEPPVIESYLFPTQVPTLQHEFKHGRSCEVVAIVELDDFGPKLEEHVNVTVEGGEEGGGGSPGAPVGAEFSSTSPATAGQVAKFTAKVSDPNDKASPHAQYRYVWEFGDGAKLEGSGAREFRTEHVYADEGRYGVKLTVTDEGGRTTEVAHTVQVNSPRVPASLPGVGAVTSDSGSGGSGGGGVSATADAHIPGATLAGTSLAVSGGGRVTLKVACPTGEASCSGTVTLRSLEAMRASVKVKKSVLTLAAGSFTVAGGHVREVVLRLSAAARALLARRRTLRVRVTLEADDPAGASQTSQAIVTLRLAKPARRR
jgi:hypothetical protein